MNDMKAIIDINDVNFEQEVLESPVPVIVDFWSPNCGPCKMLAPTLEEIAATNAGRIKVVKVNVDENPALSRTWGIQAMPTLLYFVEGTVRGQTIGATSRKNILMKLDSLLAIVA
jgi:thioredoxin 1